MKKLELRTTCKKMLADVYTPVGIYLRLRDRFRDTILLESADHHSGENSWSFIGVNAIGGIEITGEKKIEFKYPGQKSVNAVLQAEDRVPALVWEYMQRYDVQQPAQQEAGFAQGLFGYSSWEATGFFEPIRSSKKPPTGVGWLRYRLYQYVIAVNHFRDELFMCENCVNDLESDPAMVEALIKSKDVPVYPFAVCGEETSNMTDSEFLDMAEKGISSCHRGDVFQIVLSRRFQQRFTGDEFNVYRALRSINPSPYLFFFDYGDYKLLGSSPEAQLKIMDNRAVLHPIAGTVKRTGDEEADRAAADRLLKDAKENAEHVMLVDLARNDLSRMCEEVTVEHYRQVQYFSHVIHLVSEVTGKLPPGSNPFELLAKTFPAGTLSGAPKFRAMELIDAYEPTARGYYGGAIGFAGFNGSFNHAIMIRSFLSQHNTLTCQAGAGIVAASKPESELQEVNNKLGALRSAIGMAEKI